MSNLNPEVLLYNKLVQIFPQSRLRRVESLYTILFPVLILLPHMCFIVVIQVRTSVIYKAIW